MCKSVIHLSIGDFLKKIISDFGDLGMDKFYVETRGHSGLTKTNWAPLDIDGNIIQNEVKIPNSNITIIANTNEINKNNPPEKKRKSDNLDTENLIGNSLDLINTDSLQGMINEINENQSQINNLNQDKQVNGCTSIIKDNPIPEQIENNSTIFDPNKFTLNDLTPNKVFIRTIYYTIKIKDVPFISQTRIVRTQKLKREGEKMILATCSSSLDAPYCTYFVNEDI